LDNFTLEDSAAPSWLFIQPGPRFAILGENAFLWALDFGRVILA